MKRGTWSLILALALVTVGCKAAKPPVSPPPPTPVTPAPATIRTTVGVTRTGEGPGLVVEGQSPLGQIHVELRSGATVLQQADVTPKDDGWYRLSWPAPAGVAEVVVSQRGGGPELVRGALAAGENTGLFYGPNASAVRVDVVDPKAMTTLMVQGQVRAKDGKVWVELRDGANILATHPFTLDKAAPDYGTLSTKIPMAAGARTVWILTFDGKQPEVAVPIVTH